MPRVKRFVPDIQLTQEDGFMRVVDAPPAALRVLRLYFKDDKVPLAYSSVLGSLFMDWMQKGYSFTFWENKS